MRAFLPLDPICPAKDSHPRQGHPHLAPGQQQMQIRAQDHLQDLIQCRMHACAWTLRQSALVFSCFGALKMHALACAIETSNGIVHEIAARTCIQEP